MHTKDSHQCGTNHYIMQGNEHDEANGEDIAGRNASEGIELRNFS